MPTASKTTAARTASGPGYEGRFEELGGYTVAFAHWGMVVSGRLTFTYADGQDVVEAGQAYYAPPGHTPAADPGTETIEFTPTAKLQETMRVVMKNAEASAHGAAAR